MSRTVNDDNAVCTAIIAARNGAEAFLSVVGTRFKGQDECQRGLKDKTTRENIRTDSCEVGLRRRFPSFDFSTYPAVSQICSLTTLPSISSVLIFYLMVRGEGST